MIHFRSNIQTAEFGLHQIYKHSASPRVYKSDINLLHGLYILLIRPKGAIYKINKIASRYGKYTSTLVLSFCPPCALIINSSNF